MVRPEEVSEFLSRPRRTIKETAKILRLHPVTVQRLISKRKLGHYRLGRNVYISDVHIAEYLGSNEQKARKSRH
jgi:excisionase family DNA binding protein